MFKHAAIAIMAVAALGASAQKKAGGPRVKVDLKDAQGNSVGTATLMQVKKGVRMRVQLENLPAGDHAVHVHETGKCDGPDFKTAGGHFNPDNKHHGYENPEGHHAGDTPSSVTVGDDKKGEKMMLMEGAELASFANRSVVVHEKADDQKTDPSGASGNRLACGVIPTPPAAPATAE